MRHMLVLFVLVAAASWPAGAGAQAVSESAPDTSRIQPGPWRYDAILGLNLAQSTYSSNWAGGDKGAINWILQGDLTAEKQYTHWFNLSNLAQLAYGQTSDQVRDPADPNRIVYDVPEKTTDLILLESTGRFTLDRALDPYAGLRLESQFSDRGDPRGDIPFNPIRFSQAAGLAHAFIKTPEREFITRAGVSFREIFARSFADTAGTRLNNFTNVDGGFEWLTTATQPMLEKRVVYKGRLLVFFPVYYSGSDELKKFDEAAIAADPTREEVQDFWKAPEVNFQNTFTSAITKYINVNLYVQIFYQKIERSIDVDLSRPIDQVVPVVDRGVRKAGQFKQTLALGLTYTLF
jgi:hypothetical protein